MIWQLDRESVICGGVLADGLHLEFVESSPNFLGIEHERSMSEFEPWDFSCMEKAAERSIRNADVNGECFDFNEFCAIHCDVGFVSMRPETVPLKRKNKL